MAERTISQLRKGYQAANTEHGNWLSTWRDAYRLYQPQRDITGGGARGQQKGQLVFDSTGMIASQAFRSRITDALFPAFRDHIKLMPGPLIEASGGDVKEARKKLDEVTRKYHALFHRSNFLVAFDEFLHDLIIGTGVMAIEEGPDYDPFYFCAIALPNVKLREGRYGSVGGFYRNIKKPLSVVRTEWPDLNSPKAWDDKGKADPDAEVEFIDVLYEDDEQASRWHYTAFEDRDGGDLLLSKQRKYEGRGPWLATRWEKAPDEVYGRGPGLQALPDMRTANRLVELVLQNASLAVAGVYTGVNDGILNPSTVSLLPGSIIAVARNQGHPQGASLAPLERAGDFDVSQIVLNDQRMQIKQLMFDRQLPPDAGPVRSATEIVERVKDLARNTGPAFARLQRELIQPLVMRCLQIMHRKGIIDFPATIDGQYIKMEVVSPLAREQQTAEIEASVNWLQLVSQLGPEMVALTVNVEGMPQYWAERLGVPQLLVRSDAERSMMQAAVAKMLAGQMAAQQSQGAPPQGAPPPDGGEPV